MAKESAAPEPQLQVVTDRRASAQPAVKFFRVRDFEKYQHYKDRNPPWVKLHGEQLDDYEFQQLPDAVRFHVLALTWLASKTGNKIPNDPAWVGGRIGAQEPVDLEFLFREGFLEAWRPRAQESYRGGEQMDLPEGESAGGANPSAPATSAGASKVLATCLQDASNLQAGCKQVASTEAETEAEAETHTEADTAPASAVRLCGCCGASVCSEFSYGDALSLATRWKSEGRLVGGKPIQNPGGLARTLHREGTADDEIRLLLRPPPRREFTDEPCPSCLGAKLQTVPGKGARPCPDCVDEAGRRTGRRAKDFGSPSGRSP